MYPRIPKVLGDIFQKAENLLMFHAKALFKHHHRYSFQSPWRGEIVALDSPYLFHLLVFGPWVDGDLEVLDLDVCEACRFHALWGFCGQLALLFRVKWLDGKHISSCCCQIIFIHN